MTDRFPTYPIDAYPPEAPRLRGVPRTPPDRRGWGSLSDTSREQLKKNTRISVTLATGASFEPRLMTELAPLAQLLLEQTVALGFPLAHAAHPDGGLGSFVMRDIKGGSTAPSWHSWCVALDLMTKGSPRRNTWRSVIAPEMVELWESAGWGWGGRFRNPFDPHHFEYRGRPEHVPADIERAKEAAARIARRREPPPPEDMTVEQVKAVQRSVNGVLEMFGVKPLLVEDGDFGPKTTAAVEGLPTTVRTRTEALKTQLSTLAQYGAASVEDATEIEQRAQAIRQRFGGGQ